ncbi:hypothetical protein NKR23_g12474 [Pleurostoma richardsiae]|uniref:Uncharacterized protein n=1 Tax=Pleurostoma richardsiae TaxID=41990 RepID=A0AA38VFV9_9PEZI|nr:hypothetical protein NKR23_g12474 [Pleurostoma richardsiae]
MPPNHGHAQCGTTVSINASATAANASASAKQVCHHDANFGGQTSSSARYCGLPQLVSPVARRKSRTNPTETYAAAYRRKAKELEHKCCRYEELLEILRTGDETEAMGLLRRTRAGDSVEYMMAEIREGRLLLQLSDETGRTIRKSTSCETMMDAS